MYVLGRRGEVDGPGVERATDDAAVPVGHLGHYRARDGSRGAAVGLDLDRPHAVCVVGKRGSGKSYTLGVIAEMLAATDGVTPLVPDPMGTFGGLRAAGFRVVEPRLSAAAVPPASWPDLVGLDPASGPGSLVWRAASDRETLAGMREAVTGTDAPVATRRAAANHLALADEWGVFDPDAPAVEELLSAPAVVPLAGVEHAPANAVVRALAAACYRARVRGRVETVPWLLVDEAHAFFGGIAAAALRRLLTRGRAPGVGLVVATQRPTALPDVARSQSDLLFAHQLTTDADRAAVRAARPDGGESLDGRWPSEPGEALVFDDATERLARVSVRERRTPHGGGTARASGESADAGR